MPPSPAGRPLRDEVEAEPQDASAPDAADFPLEQDRAGFELRAGKAGADVLVVSGRPRYHVDGCSYVEPPAHTESLEINEARGLGFTPCGECRPNETLATG